MTFTLPGVAIPGLATPGVLDPALPAGASAVTVWRYASPVPVFYLQYIGPDGHVLNPQPGQAYTAGTIMVASGEEPGLAVPPGDGRWISA